MAAGPQRRRPGGARPDGPLLQREQIVDAALSLTRRHGLGGMSMRKLGDELGVTSMAIYWYFESKDELVDAITDSVLAAVRLPGGDAAPWDQRLRDVSWAVHDVLVDYPGIADQLLTYQNFPPSAVPLVEYGVATLRSAGFDEQRAASAFNAVSSYVISRSHFEAHQHLVLRDEAGDASVADRALRGWQRLGRSIDPEHVPHAHSYVEQLERVGAATLVFEHGLELLLSGLRAELER